MKILTVKLAGQSMLMHSARTANPLDPATMLIHELAQKRGKTHEDILRLARLEWEAGLYLSSKGDVVMPISNLYKCFLDGARKTKNGKQFEPGVVLTGGDPILTFAGVKLPRVDVKRPFPQMEDEKFDAFYADHNYTCTVAIQRQRCLRCRPFFADWSCEVTLTYNPEIINSQVLIKAINDSGQLCGLCDWRPRYGQFEAKVISDVSADKVKKAA